MSETVEVDKAVMVFREAVVQVQVERARRGEIPCDQIGMLADIAANQYRAALFFPPPQVQERTDR